MYYLIVNISNNDNLLLNAFNELFSQIRFVFKSLKTAFVVFVVVYLKINNFQNYYYYISSIYSFIFLLSSLSLSTRKLINGGIPY